MYVLRQYKTAFVHIPKTGGTAIARHIFWPHGFERLGGRPRHRGYLPGLIPVDWFVFAFVRNPYERIVSMYRHQSMNPSKLDTSSLSRFIRTMRRADQELGKPTEQVDFLAPRVEVFRYEDFEASIDRICERMGIVRPDLWKDESNKFFGAYDWRDYVDVQGLKEINAAYRRDFDGLGYEMKTWRQIRSWTTTASPASLAS